MQQNQTVWMLPETEFWNRKLGVCVHLWTALNFKQEQKNSLIVEAKHTQLPPSYIELGELQTKDDFYDVHLFEITDKSMKTRFWKRFYLMLVTVKLAGWH